jgi:integrase
VITALFKNDIRDNRIRVVTQKTSQKVVIPLHPTVKSILIKYDFNLPRQISNDKFNEYIREVAKKAELNEIFVKRITKAGKIVKTSKPIHEFVSTHAARRSFATNMFLKGVPAIVIMGITGHKSEKEFLNYITIVRLICRTRYKPL